VAESSGGGGSPGDGPPTPGQSMAANGFGESENGTELWAVQESGSAVPFILFPPGIDTSNLKIFEVEKSQKGAERVSSAQAESFGGESNGPMNITSGGCDCPSMGFFRVFLVPDFFYDYSQYQFSYGVEFMPIYLGGRCSGSAECTNLGQRACVSLCPLYPGAI